MKVDALVEIYSFINKKLNLIFEQESIKECIAENKCLKITLETLICRLNKLF
jgi:hypothetical protein